MSKGDLAKTNRVDAVMLAAYGRAFPDFAASEPKGTFLKRLESLLVARERLAGTRVSLRQAGRELAEPEETLLVGHAKRMTDDIDGLEILIRSRIRTWSHATGSCSRFQALARPMPPCCAA